MRRGRAKGVKSVSKSRHSRTDAVRAPLSKQYDDQGFTKRQIKNKGDNSRRRFQRKRYRTFGCVPASLFKQPFFGLVL